MDIKEEIIILQYASEKQIKALLHQKILFYGIDIRIAERGTIIPNETPLFYSRNQFISEK